MERLRLIKAWIPFFLENACHISYVGRRIQVNVNMEDKIQDWKVLDQQFGELKKRLYSDHDVKQVTR